MRIISLFIFLMMKIILLIIEKLSIDINLIFFNLFHKLSDIFRSAQEGESGDIFAFVSSFIDSSRDMDLREIHSWGTWYFGKSYK